MLSGALIGSGDGSAVLTAGVSVGAGFGVGAGAAALRRMKKAATSAMISAIYERSIVRFNLSSLSSA